MRFLSDEWFAQAAELAGTVQAPQGGAARVQFTTGDTAWYIAASEGKPVEFAAGRLDDPAVELQFDRADAVRIWRREMRGEDAMARMTVIDPPYTGPPAPGDLPQRPELDALLAVPDANVTVQYHFDGGPFGPVAHVLCFESGRLVRDQWGTVDNADVVVSVRYDAITPVRRGEWTVIDALEHGSITGEIGPMAMLAGILESPEFQAAEQACSDHGYALAVLGKLDADPAFTQAMEQLAQETDPE